jgi:hypothetical protein
VRAPFTFVGLVVLCLGLGFGGAKLLYSGQIATLHEQLGTKDGEIGRYRVALGIDTASKGALIELTDQELQAKSATTVRNLRDLCLTLQNQDDQLQSALNAGKIDKKGQWERHLAIDKELSNEFVPKDQSDAFNVDNELRRRLRPEAVAAIVGITPSIIADDGIRIDMLTLATGGNAPFSVEFTCTLADGIEQMAKMLPSDSKTP